MTVSRWCVLIVVLTAVSAQPCRAQALSTADADTRTQYPPLLANGYFGLGVGAIDVPFTASQLQPGYQAFAIRTPHPAFQITLLGRQFNRYFSGEMNYTRPVRWARYDNVNNSGANDSVWVVLGEFKLRARVPIGDRVFVYGDAGVAVTSRHGARTADGAVVVQDAHYPALLTGAGVEYRVNDRWSLLGGFTRAAASRTHNQPRALLFSSGIRYHLHPLPADRVADALRGGFIFPKQILLVGYAASLAGYGPNHFFSKTVPIFWGGNLSVDHGFTVRYERNLFHTTSRFAFDLGASGARWHAPKSSEHLASVSLYPLLRFFLIRTRSADLHVYYSLAGPTILSRADLNGVPLGTNRFSFQDLMGVSVLAGRTRNVLIGVGLGHYSNGNLFPINAGVAIPLAISLGYAF